MIFSLKFDGFLVSTLKSLVVHTCPLVGDSISLLFLEHWVSAIIVLSAVYAFFCVIQATVQWVDITRPIFQMMKLKTGEVK